MTRTKISLAIFVFLVVYILFSINKIYTITTETNILCDEIHDFVISSNWEEAHTESERLLKLWNKNSKAMFVYVNTNELDLISCEIVKLTDYTQYKNKSEAIPCISVIKYLINEINALEKITWHNIL
ncbi:DUF4363 family protein [Oceanirhabdus sp. W0125-5]|uniref:DUF4363 family protein n=1 Tax=Oceanirhabdus sp. W0125-5 TaxID=2999116 RepID=UPI0022F2B49D|nr:DUF4363 family protein [Oceanirhabdus sp. W0125-5]WBW98780.1 DUF4363 family protein [Oceanirhabdus sp. W0125-5]